MNSQERNEAAVHAVLRVMEWPDDREASAHVERCEPAGCEHEITPAGQYWELAAEIATAVLAAWEGDPT